MRTLSSLDAGGESRPELADLDGDDDLDLVVGVVFGALRYFVNTGSSVAPVFVEITGSDNPWTGFDTLSASVPTLIDLDGDGDLDGVVGNALGTLHYFANTGSSASPAFLDETGSANPFDGVDVGYASAADLADLDGDGDFDAVVGLAAGELRWDPLESTCRHASLSIL